MLKRAGFVLVGLLCILAIAPATAPVQFSYVYSDSMEPTIGEFDGYLLVPAGDATTGDIVTFWSPERNAYVTHRIAGESDRGFITKGDNNPSTDQAAGTAHVSQDQIVGQVFTVHDTPVLVPGFGHGVQFVDAHRISLAGVLGAILLVGLLRGRTTARPTRSVPCVRDVLWPVFAVALVSTIGFQFVGGQSEQLRYVAVTSDTGGANRISVGETATESVTIDRSPLPATVQVVSADGMTITNQTRNASAITASFQIPPPTQTGVVTTSVRVNRYAAVLPARIIRRLHGIHPLLAASATAVITLFPVVLGAALTIDGKRPLRPAKNSWVRRLKRGWREL